MHYALCSNLIFRVSIHLVARWCDKQPKKILLSNVFKNTSKLAGTMHFNLKTLSGTMYLTPKYTNKNW